MNMLVYISYTIKKASIHLHPAGGTYCYSKWRNGHLLHTAGHRPGLSDLLWQWLIWKKKRILYHKPSFHKPKLPVQLYHLNSCLWKDTVGDFQGVVAPGKSRRHVHLDNTVQLTEDGEGSCAHPHNKVLIDAVIIFRVCVQLIDRLAPVDRLGCSRGRKWLSFLGKDNETPYQRQQ